MRVRSIERLASDERRQDPHRHRRLDLSAVARRLLSRQARRKRKSSNMRRGSWRDRDQRAPSTAARSPKSWETWAGDRSRRLPVRGQRLALLRHAVPKLCRSGEGYRQFLRAGLRRARAEARADPVACSPRAANSTATISPRFIDLLPEKLDGITLRHAIEPRHESFRDDALLRPLPRAQYRGRVRRRRRIIRASRPIPRTSPMLGCSG